MTFTWIRSYRSADSVVCVALVSTPWICPFSTNFIDQANQYIETWHQIVFISYLYTAHVLSPIRIAYGIFNCATWRPVRRPFLRQAFAGHELNTTCSSGCVSFAFAAHVDRVASRREHDAKKGSKCSNWPGSQLVLFRAHTIFKRRRQSIGNPAG